MRPPRQQRVSFGVFGVKKGSVSITSFIRRQAHESACGERPLKGKDWRRGKPRRALHGLRPPRSPQSSHRCLGHVGQGSIPCSRRLDRGFARDRRHLPDRIREDAAPAAGPHRWLIQACCCPERGLGPSCQPIFAASLSVEPRSLGCARRSPLLLCTAARHATEALWTAPCARRPRGKRKAACACAPWLALAVARLPGDGGVLTRELCVWTGGRHGACLRSFGALQRRSLMAARSRAA